MATAERLTAIRDRSLALLDLLWLLDDAARNFDSPEVASQIAGRLANHLAATVSGTTSDELSLLAATHSGEVSHEGTGGLSYVEIVTHLAADRYSYLVHRTLPLVTTPDESPLAKWALEGQVVPLGRDLLLARWTRLAEGLTGMRRFSRDALSVGIRKEHAEAVRRLGQITASDPQKPASTPDTGPDRGKRINRRRPNKQAVDCGIDFVAELKSDPTLSRASFVRDWARAHSASFDSIERIFNDNPDLVDPDKVPTKSRRKKISNR